MGRFVIEGNRRLDGEVTVSGSKNAALPIIFSTLIINGVSVLRNLPDIGDVDVALELIRCFGAQTVRAGSTLTIDTRDLTYTRPPRSLTEKIRASTYLIGATLARFGVAHVGDFGGCNFDTRPIDMHLYAAGRLGATVDGDGLSASRLVGKDIYFDKASVGATVNAIIMASRASGKTNIYNPALEPHVLSLVSFLKRAGIKFTVRVGCISVTGGEPCSSSAKIIPDMIEAGTYISLSLLTQSHVLVKGVDRAHLDSFLAPLVNAGAVLEYDRDTLLASGELDSPIDVVTATYPGFPTDLQPIIAPLMLKYDGGSITESVWRGRFGYLCELASFGARFSQNDSKATLYKSALHSAHAVATDLRGGASLVITALSTEGQSVIEHSETVKRGYDNIVNKLRRLGASIYEE